MSKGVWKANIGPRKAADGIGPGDPARGEKVPRCTRCGMPERPKYPLYPGLWAYIRLHIEVTFCAECVTELLPNRMALDPLTLDEVA